MVASISVGSVSIDVVPNVQGFGQRIRRQIVPQARQIGQQIGQQIGRQISEETRRNLDGVRLDIDTTAAVSGLRRLREELDRLDGRRVNVSVGLDVREEIAQTMAFSRVLERLDGHRAMVAVDVDVLSGMAQVEALNRLLERVESRTVRVDVDTAPAVAGLNLLSDAGDRPGRTLSALSGTVATLTAGLLAVGPAAGPLLLRPSPALGRSPRHMERRELRSARL